MKCEEFKKKSAIRAVSLRSGSERIGFHPSGIEQVDRFQRTRDTIEQMRNVVAGMVGKRLMYSQLIADKDKE